jgi:chemotaxis protein CheX
MNPSAPITDDLIHASIVSAVQNVCSTMLKFDASFLEKTPEPNNESFRGKQHVFGCVGFVGKIDGVVHLCITNDFAVHAASTLLGLSMAEALADEGTVKDVVGEITNMTVGSFKNALCDKGYTCKLTLPTIVKGQNLAVATVKSSSRHIFHFDTIGHRLVADIQILER